MEGFVPIRSANFPFHLSKVLHLPRKSEARSYEVLHLSRKVTLANLKIWCSKMQPLSGNQLPDLLTSLMSMSLVLRLPRKMHLSRSSSNVPRLPSFLEMLQNPHVLSLWARCRIPCTCHAKPHLNLQKSSGHVGFLNILTWKCASRHNGVHFFDISTSKSSPTLVCFIHFDCSEPQRRALFHTFSTSQRLKVRFWCALHLLTSKRASRHNGVQLFISLSWPHGSAPALASLLFDPPEPQIIGKTQWIATFLSFRAPASSFFSLFLFSDLLSSALLFSDSSHLCFSICPYCRKFHFETSFGYIYIYIYIYIYHIVHIFHRNLTRYISWDTYRCNLTSM